MGGKNFPQNPNSPTVLKRWNLPIWYLELTSINFTNLNSWLASSHLEN